MSAPVSAPRPAPEPEPRDSIELRFEPRWTHIDCVRRFVAGFFLIGLADRDRAERISMATSELLENAVKYSAEEAVTVSIRSFDGEVEVRVTNAADDTQQSALRREFALATAGDAEKTYLARMRESALAGGGSGRLGLARIRYEGGARLRLETRPGVVSIHALFPLESA